MSTENFVGVDVSKDKLDVAVYPANQLFSVENNQNGLDQLAQSLGDLHPQLIVF
jgi:transposase